MSVILPQGPVLPLDTVHFLKVPARVPSLDEEMILGDFQVLPTVHSVRHAVGFHMVALVPFRRSVSHDHAITFLTLDPLHAFCTIRDIS